MNFIHMTEIATTPTTEQAQQKPKYSPSMAQILGKDVYGNPLNAEPAAQTTPNPAEPPKVETPATPAAATPAPVTPPVEDEDAKFLARYNKIHGTEFESIADISKPKHTPTKEEIEAQENKERIEAFEYALENKLFTKEDYDNSVIAKAKPAEEIAKKIFIEEYKAEFPNAKDSEAEEEFKEFYGLHHEADSARFKLGQKKIKEVADNYMKQFEKIDNHVDSYKEYKTVAEKQKNFKSNLKVVSETLPTEMTFTIPVEGKETGETYSFPISEDMKKDIYTEFSKNNWAFNAFDAANSQVKEKDLLEAMKNTLQAKYFTKMVEHVAAEHGKKQRMGLLAELKGVPATTAGQPTINSAPTLPPKVVARSEQARQRLGL